MNENVNIVLVTPIYYQQPANPIQWRTKSLCLGPDGGFQAKPSGAARKSAKRPNDLPTAAGNQLDCFQPLCCAHALFCIELPPPEGRR